MDTDALRSLSAMAMSGGLFFTSLGGIGYYYFGRVAGSVPEKTRVPGEPPLQAKVDALEKANDELRRRVADFESAARAVAPVQPESPKAEAAEFQARPTPVPVKAPPPPLKKAETTVWEGGDLLEEMIAATTAEPRKQSGGLGEKQRRDMVKVLRRHAGGRVSIQPVAGDHESREFAYALRSTFLEAGWNVQLEEKEYAKPPSGLSVSTTLPAPEEAVTVSGALAVAGIHFVQWRDSKLTGEQTVVVVGRNVKQAL